MPDEIDDIETLSRRAEAFWARHQTTTPAPGFWDNPYLAVVADAKTEGKWYLEYLRDTYLGGRPAKRALSIGCGAGEIDRRAFSKNVFSHVTGVDFSTGGLEVARRNANEMEMPALYFRRDLNVDKLPDEALFDLVYDYASSHHIANLEHLMKEVERVLSDDGYFVLYGYCGPTRMQWTPRTLELVNELLCRVPMRLRATMPELHRPSIWEFIRGDPSEAVRGSDIVDVVRSFFDVIEEIDIGYTISHPMFAQNAYNFDLGVPSEQAILRLICQYEELLIEHNVVSADVKVLICRRRREVPYRPQREL